MTTHEIAKQWLSVEDTKLDQNYYIPALEYVPGTNDDLVASLRADNIELRKRLIEIHALTKYDQA